MAFEGLTEKINSTFKKLRGKGRLKEADVKEAMREIRMALLEADVSYKVCKDFTKQVTERCVGTDVLESLPGLTRFDFPAGMFTTEEIAYINEYGAPRRGISARPFISTAMAQGEDEIAAPADEIIGGWIEKTYGTGS